MTEPRELAAIRVRLAPGEVLRYLGYPQGKAPDPGVLRRVEDLLPGAKTHIRTRGIHRIEGIAAQGPDRLRLEGGAALRGAFGPILGTCRAAALFVVTAGGAIERASREAFDRGDRVGGLVLDAIGSAAVDAACAVLEADVRAAAAARGWAATAPCHPGYCGVSLEAQRDIFARIPAARIGVELLPSLIMRPAKSASGLIGLGEPGAITPHARPCARCDREDCRMRRLAPTATDPPPRGGPD